MKVPKLQEINRFYKTSIALLCLLALVRWMFPGVMQQPAAPDSEGENERVEALLTQEEEPEEGRSAEEGEPCAKEEERFAKEKELCAEEESRTQDSTSPEAYLSTSDVSTRTQASPQNTLHPLPQATQFDEANKHRIFSVSGTYVSNFPDIQDVHYPSATRWGITPLRNRNELAKYADQLVYVGSNPYIHLDENMSQSIPYLVPRASDLLEHLGKAFMDSLYAKRIPLHKFIVSSVLRTEEDVAQLSTYNPNATERSCHMFGTTFDISYNRYYTVSAPGGPKRREVRNDSLKWVLSEVLRDARNEGRCHIRYEVKMPCFHITVR